MRLPNKVTSYSESVLSKLPIVLDRLTDGDVSPYVLYQDVVDKFAGVSEYIDALDCLFALKKIEFSVTEGVLHYVV